jgi:hypothetical protein
MEGSVLTGATTRKKAREVSGLGLKCDAHENPRLLSGDKLDHWWIAANCIYWGSTYPEYKVGELGDLTPTSHKSPALWWS